METVMRLMLFVAGVVIFIIATLSDVGFFPTLIATLTGVGLMMRSIW